VIITNPEVLARLAQKAKTVAVQDKLIKLHLSFILNLLFNPARLHLDEATSNRCGTSNFNSLKEGSSLIVCHDNAWEQAAPAWSAWVDVQATSDPDIAAVADDLKSLYLTIPITSWADFVMTILSPTGYYPKGKVPDSPSPAYTPDKGFGGWCSAQIPKKWLAEGNDDVFQVLTSRGGEHATGGNVAIAHDQMTAVPQTERESGLASTGLNHDLNQELTERLLASFLGDAIATGASFPGISELNHLCVDSFGPLRANMSKPCPSSYTTAQKEKECYSPQESVWGTEILAKLEHIKQKVDPEHLFDCYPCVKPTTTDTPRSVLELLV
jgi:hypothetical protein